jgi:hypothetical protein
MTTHDPHLTEPCGLFDNFPIRRGPPLLSIPICISDRTLRYKIQCFSVKLRHFVRKTDVQRDCLFSTEQCDILYFGYGIISQLFSLNCGILSSIRLADRIGTLIYLSLRKLLVIVKTKWCTRNVMEGML